MVERYGRYLLLSKRDLDMARQVLRQAMGRSRCWWDACCPIVRTFIAFPAGVARMNQVRFHIYTFIGSFPWCYVLAYIGMKLGASWNSDPRFKAVLRPLPSWRRGDPGDWCSLLHLDALEEPREARHRLSQQFAHRRLQSSEWSAPACCAGHKESVHRRGR